MYTINNLYTILEITSTHTCIRVSEMYTDLISSNFKYTQTWFSQPGLSQHRASPTWIVAACGKAVTHSLYRPVIILSGSLFSRKPLNTGHNKRQGPIFNMFQRSSGEWATGKYSKQFECTVVPSKRLGRYMRVSISFRQLNIFVDRCLPNTRN